MPIAPITITVQNVTDPQPPLAPGAVPGDGSFDKLMATVVAHLESQLAQGNITGKDYATLYGTSLVEVLKQSVVWELSVEKLKIEVEKLQAETDKVLADKDLIAEKIIAEKIKNGDPEYINGGAHDRPESVYSHNKLVLEKQKLLYKRQAEGFDDNKRQKVLDSALSAWSITREDVPDNGDPEFVQSDFAIKHDKVGTGWVIKPICDPTNTAEYDPVACAALGDVNVKTAELIDKLGIDGLFRMALQPFDQDKLPVTPPTPGP